MRVPSIVVCGLFGALGFMACGGERPIVVRPSGTYLVTRLTLAGAMGRELRTEEELCVQVSEGRPSVLDVLTTRVEVEGSGLPEWEVNRVSTVGQRDRIHMDRHGETQRDGRPMRLFLQPRLPDGSVQTGRRWSQRYGTGRSMEVAHRVERADSDVLVIRGVGSAGGISVEERVELRADGFAGTREVETRIRVVVDDSPITRHGTTRVRIEPIARCPEVEPLGPTMPPPLEPPPLREESIALRPEDGASLATDSRPARLRLESSSYESILLRYRVPRVGSADEVAFGRDTVCVRVGPQVRCWVEPGEAAGSMVSAQMIEGVGEVTRLTAVRNAMCARSNRWHCWGDNPRLRSGERRFGDGAPVLSTPVPLVQLGEAVQIVAGGFPAICGRFADGHVECQDRGTLDGPPMAQLHAGDPYVYGTTAQGQVMVQRGARWTPFGGGTSAGSTAGDRRGPSCVLDEEQVLRCGVGADPVHPVAEVVAAWASPPYRCLRTPSGRVACWSYAIEGLEWIGLGNVTSLAAGDGHVCAETTAGPVYCWGPVLGSTPVRFFDEGPVFTESSTVCRPSGPDMECIRIAD